MTRKDILLKITMILDNLENVCTNKMKAQAILDELQTLGMLPPKTSKYKFIYKPLNQIRTLDDNFEWED